MSENTPAETNYPSFPSQNSGSTGNQNTMGTLALVMGIVQFFCLGPLGSVLAVIFGIIGLKKVKAGAASNRGVALSGLILGIVGLVLSVIIAVVVVLIGGAAVSTVQENLDPIKNSQTGLPDGSYYLLPTDYLVINTNCSFSGSPIDVSTEQAVGPEISVVGTDAGECNYSQEMPVRVVFDVVSGVAKIQEVQ